MTSLLRHLQDSRVARALFWSAAVFAFVMAVLPHPPRLLVEPSDKVQHAVAFATLGLLGAWAYNKRSQFWTLAGLSLFGALIEVLQAIPALHREADPLDWLADTAAASAALLFAWALRRLRA